MPGCGCVLLPILLLVVTIPLLLFRIGRFIALGLWALLVAAVLAIYLDVEYIDRNPSAPVPTEALVGTWRNGDFTLTLNADGTFLMPQRPPIVQPLGDREPVGSPGTWRQKLDAAELDVELTWHGPHATDSDVWVVEKHFGRLQLTHVDGDPDGSWYAIERDR